MHTKSYRHRSPPLRKQKRKQNPPPKKNNVTPNWAPLQRRRFPTLEIRHVSYLQLQWLVVPRENFRSLWVVLGISTQGACLAQVLKHQLNSIFVTRARNYKLQFFSRAQTEVVVWSPDFSMNLCFWFGRFLGTRARNLKKRWAKNSRTTGTYNFPTSLGKGWKKNKQRPEKTAGCGVWSPISNVESLRLSPLKLNIDTHDAPK